MKKVFLINLSFFISEYFIASSASLADVPICLLKTHWTILLLNISERWQDLHCLSLTTISLSVFLCAVPCIPCVCVVINSNVLMLSSSVFSCFLSNIQNYSDSMLQKVARSDIGILLKRGKSRQPDILSYSVMRLILLSPGKKKAGLALNSGQKVVWVVKTCLR